MLLAQPASRPPTHALLYTPKPKLKKKEGNNIYGESFWITAANKSRPINTRSHSQGAPSPNKHATSSSSRGVSPSRLRNGASPNTLSNGSVQRGRIGENRIVDAHSLRLLYNRLLQWRFANATAHSHTHFSLQRFNAEKSLYDARFSASKLRESVRAKRTELRLLKQQFQLMSILKEQMIYLEDWAILDPVYCSSLSGAIQALKASTLRLPVVDGAKADVLKVMDAVCSAMDVMKAMASSISLLLPKVGHVNSLVVEVANLSAKEHVLVDECKNLLSMVTIMQIRNAYLFWP
ncbi:QWRF family [Sesbania bispinosa]|nr:QWRF family [Sesbania bispinosa]